MNKLFAKTSILTLAITLLLSACKKESNEFAVVKAPTVVAPANNGIIPLDAAMKAVAFRWTPLVPKPALQVTYRLRVWQLMQGQNASTAMRSNQPIVTKDVADITEVTVNGLITGPCRPPYLCDFVWNVSVVSKDANGTVTETSVSDTGNFSIN